ncbi:L,D-transpeptidase family protein [Streptomyces alkaliphilus]|uniref:L,D-transpeptidase family protein n=1 Tax=Streptomyces alkaliphilus TaxID=1472722 RepID=A0A7W3TF84_9ACTN|nr:peptidoglycan-binding protein [Streptomyces alkaliphilus]MBB0245642.1 L,D-transpeptidase family protein [Streptomyces alkaliphilus]
MRSAHIRRSVVAVAAAALLLTACGSGSDTGTEPVANEATTEVTAEPEEQEEEPEEEPEETDGDEEEPEEPEAPAEAVVMGPGDNSEQVRELQARLAQVGHFVAKPTGFYGDMTVGSVAAYQEAHEGLEVSGTVHTSTWEHLRARTTEPTRDELFPREQVMGYGDDSEQVRELQARLGQLGLFDENPTGYYGNVTVEKVKAYQRSAGLEVSGTVYDDTWSALTSATTQPAREEMYVPVEVPVVEKETPAGLDSRCMTGRALCISKTTNKLSWVVDGTVRTTLDVRFGTEEYPTREGQFTVYWKSRDHHSTLYDSPMPFAMFFDGGQAVHYSENFRQNGYTGGSYGCVNVRDRDAIASLFDQVHEGDKVVVHW